MKKSIWFAVASAGALFVLMAQDARIIVEKGGIPVIALPDLRGAGDAQKFMAAFNETLTDDVKGAGRFKIAAKTSLPTFVPQQPSDFQQPPPPRVERPVRGRQQAAAGGPTYGWGSLDAGLVEPAGAGELSGFRLHRRAERSAGVARVVLRSK